MLLSVRGRIKPDVVMHACMSGVGGFLASGVQGVWGFAVTESEWGRVVGVFGVVCTLAHEIGLLSA